MFSQSHCIRKLRRRSSVRKSATGPRFFVIVDGTLITRFEKIILLSEQKGLHRNGYTKRRISMLYKIFDGKNIESQTKSEEVDSNNSNNVIPLDSYVIINHIYKVNHWNKIRS